MRFWLDAQMSPALAAWIAGHFDVAVDPVRDLGLLRASDEAIFSRARDAGVVIITKDSDFVRLVQRHGSPPQILWITCGNTSNTRMAGVLSTAFIKAIELLRAGESLVEITGDAKPEFPVNQLL